MRCVQRQRAEQTTFAATGKQAHKGRYLLLLLHNRNQVSLFSRVKILLNLPAVDKWVAIVLVSVGANPQALPWYLTPGLCPPLCPIHPLLSFFYRCVWKLEGFQQLGVLFDLHIRRKINSGCRADQLIFDSLCALIGFGYEWEG